MLVAPTKPRSLIAEDAGGRKEAIGCQCSFRQIGTFYANQADLYVIASTTTWKTILD